MIERNHARRNAALGATAVHAAVLSLNVHDVREDAIIYSLTFSSTEENEDNKYMDENTGIKGQHN